MVVLVRVVRVALLLVLAVVVIALVIGLGDSGTGVLEKLALVALIVGCVGLAYLLSKWTDRIQGRLGTR